MQENIKDVTIDIVSIISIHFISFEEYLISGSYAENKETEKSDIDIFALSKYVNNISIENVIYGGKCYQFIIFPYHKTYWLECFFQKGYWVYHSMIKKGIIVKSSSPDILNKLKMSLLKKKLGLNNHAHLFHRYRLTELLNDVSLTNSKEENLFIGIDIINTIAKILTYGYEKRGKHLGQELIANPKASSCIIDSLKQLACNNDLEHLVSFAEEILGQQGGCVKSYSTNYATLSADLYSCLLIQLPNHDIYQDNISQVITDLIEIIPPEYVYHIFYIGNNQFLERGLYIHIYISEETESSSLINRINDFINSNMDRLYKENIRMSFPYQIGFNPSFLFGGDNIFSLFLPYFKRLSLIILAKRQEGCYNNKSDIFTPSFSILLILFTFLIEDNSDLENFILQRLDSYKCEAIDPNNCLNNSQLESAANTIMKHNQELYIKQYSVLRAIKNYYFNSTSGHGQNNILLDEISSWSIDLVKCVKSIPDNSIHYSYIFFQNTHQRDILLNSITDHIFNIFCIEPHEKYTITFYLHNFLKDQKNR